jgi:translation initiation factor IF-3
MGRSRSLTPLSRNVCRVYTRQSIWLQPPILTPSLVRHYEPKRPPPIPHEIVPHVVDDIPLINNRIPSPTVQMVDEHGSLLPPIPIQKVLQMIDPYKNFLAMVSKPGQINPPVCRILNRIDELKRLRQVAKAQSKKKKTTSPKQIELNWAIDPNDFSHKLDQLQGFLEKGYKVEVFLARKRRGRQATPEDGEEILQRLNEIVKKVDGAFLWKPMEGKALASATLYFGGRGATIDSQPEPAKKIIEGPS